MQNITLSAPKELIEQARRRATASGTSLNEEFRKWLDRYADRQKIVEQYDDLMKRLSYVRPGRKFTRKEMNER